MRIVLGILWGLAIGSSLIAEPATPNECKNYWRGLGIQNTLYNVEGEESYAQYYDRIRRHNCFKEWLIVVYMAADNDLSPYSYRDLWEMEAVGSAASVDVVVFHDSAKEDGIRYYHIAKNPNKIDYKKRLANFVQREKLEDHTKEQQEEAFLSAEGASLVTTPPAVTLAEGDSGDIGTAGEFMHWVLTRYPSRRLMLMGWSHGDGFDAKAMRALAAERAFFSSIEGKQGGFAFDHTSRNHMAVTEMAAGVKELMEQYRKGAEVDIAGSDACLNQQVEFGYEWTGVAKYVFGSSSIVQKKGMNYRALLDWFASHPLFSTDQAAAQIPILYGNSVSANGSGRTFSSYHDPAATMATWTVSELGHLKWALEELALELTQWLDEPQSSVEKIDRVSEMKRLIAKGERFGNVSYDLHTFLLTLNTWARENLDNQAGVRFSVINDKINAAQGTLNRSVLSKYIGEKYQKGLLRTSKGVAIWLPATPFEFKEMYPKFLLGKFYAGEIGSGPSHWSQFVGKLGGTPR